MPSKKRNARAKAPLVPTPSPRKGAAAPFAASATPGGEGRERGFPIVGIGASAGGLEALEELFAQMPNDTGVAFVVVTHLHPGHTSLLPELLGKITALKVVQAADGLKVEPNHVYVSPPGGCLAILDGTLHRMDTERRESPHLPIDYFLRSLAADQKDKAICVILSGTGTDGTLGMQAIKGDSGMAMVQQVQSAKYAGMPSSALATGLADYVLPPAEMPGRLVAYARGPYLTTAHTEEPTTALSESLQKIFVLLRSRTGHDFSSYKSSAIHRRIERRMNLHQMKGTAHYVRYLQENPREIDLLFKELLISVTNFFRDPEAFRALAEAPLPALIKSCPANHTLRVWAPGCATGEDVFSLAILIRECMEAANHHCEAQIFGTDLDTESIETARVGRYPEGISIDVFPERLARYFVYEDGYYRIRAEIREMAIFAVQNVIKDPPFTKLDLICCRNLLIYFTADLQRRLIPVFHYALKPGGLLFLGSSESIGGFDDLFDTVDKKWRIFRRKDVALAPRTFLDFPAQPAGADQGIRPPAARPPRESNITSLMERALLARFAPASVVVSDRGDVVYFHGRTGAFFEFASGQPRLNILDMAREGLKPELASALRQASVQDTEVTRDGVRVRTNGGFARVKISVVKLQEPESVRGLMLVTFHPQPAPEEKPRPKARNRNQRELGQVKELERELRCTRESLETTIKELETANEELKSSNEELQSTNEELQSTSEEMETSREEMQSLNEELTTVNAEMESKVEELSGANDDMQNLLNSTEIATLFLDRDLHIKRYTEQAKRLINLIPTDVGRPLGDLVTSLAYGQLVRDCREVLRTLVFKLAEVQTKDRYWYLMRIMPYRTAENVIEGVVVIFVDINPVKAAEKSLLRMSKVFLDGPEPMIIMDLAARIVEANEEAVRAYGWSRQEMIGQPFQMTVSKSQNRAASDGFQKCLAGTLDRSVECGGVTKAGREFPASLTFKLLTDDRGLPDAICLLIKLPPN